MADEPSQSPVEAPRIVVVPAGERIISTPAERERMRASAGHLARLLDTAFEIPGTRLRIGLDPLLGLIPVIGDLISMLVGSYIVLVAVRLGVPRVVVWRMLVNLGIDLAIGSVPVVGDLLDVAWKANLMNARLLDRALADPRAAARSSRWVLAGLVALMVAVVAGVVLLFVYLIRWLFEATQ